MFERRLSLICALAMMLTTDSVAAGPLTVPPGQDPGGPAVAVITHPFDINDAHLQARLARDGEGEAIGWNFSTDAPQDGESELTENDPAPPRPSPVILPPSEAVRTLIATDGVRLIPVFVAPGDATSWAKAVAFIARTPAQIIAVPSPPQTPSERQALEAAAGHFSQLLLVMPAPLSEGSEDAATRFQYGAPLNNVVLVGTEANQTSDAVLIGTGGEIGPDLAVAQTVKTLMLCPPRASGAAETLSKPDALTILRANPPETENPNAQNGALTFAPCTAATQ